MRHSNLPDWLLFLEQLHASEIELGLERITRVAECLGIRSNAVVITVAGTNGKGSTVAVMESILAEAGYRVGVYTSPHLLLFNERIKLDSTVADDQMICKALQRVDDARADISLTYFEFTTLAALLILQQAELDVWLLEVGLGGRLDAVNVIDPDVAVITSIALDHQSWLGNDRESIGREKAGIMRAGVPVVCGDPQPPQSLYRHAQELGADWQAVGEHFHFNKEGSGWCWSGCDSNGQQINLQELPMPGIYLANAATALQALYAAGLNINRDSICQGLLTVAPAGRYQRIVYQGMNLLLDVAHNPAAAEVLAEFLERDSCQGRTWTVFAALADKDVQGMVSRLAAQVDGWVVTGLPGVTRARSVEDLTGQLSRQKIAVLGACSSMTQALESAASVYQPGDRVIVWGSFYTVAEVLRRASGCPVGVQEKQGLRF